MKPLLNELVLLQKNCRESTREDIEAKYLELRKFLQVESLTNEHGVFTVYETIECIKTFNKKTLHNSINYVRTQPIYGVNFWFSSIQYTHLDGCYFMLPAVEGNPHLSRNSAIRAAVFDFYRCLSLIPPKTKNEIKLNIELLKWLKSVEQSLEDTTETWFCCDAGQSQAIFNGRYSEATDNYCCSDCDRCCTGPWQMSDGDKVLDVETAINVFGYNYTSRHVGHSSISDKREQAEGNEQPDDPDDPDEPDDREHVEDSGGQMRLNDGKDGFTRPEDVENSSRFQTFYKELDMLNNDKKQMAMLQKAYSRRALYLSFVVAIELAKQNSVLAPDEIFFVADDLEKVKVFSVEGMKENNIDKMLFYCVYLNGVEVDESVLREALQKNT